MQVMDSEVRRFIDNRISMLEQQHKIKVLLWAVRGSYDIGIYRDNSDLDIVFIFNNIGSNKCAAIHDIIGHGLDFWGWNISQTLETVCQNTNMFYKNVRKPINNIFLSKEHDRGSLTYYFGFFCAFGSKNNGGNKIFIDNMNTLLGLIMEKRVLINHVLSGVMGKVDKIYATGMLSANEYLYTVWRILLAKHIYYGGLPGESNIEILIEKYGSNTKNDVIDLMIKYRCSRAKHTQRCEISNINRFIIEEYPNISQKAFNLIPENIDCFNDSILELKLLSNKCCL